jgi:hypothetical protein
VRSRSAPVRPGKHIPRPVAPVRSIGCDLQPTGIMHAVRACGCALELCEDCAIVLMGRAHLGSSVMKKKAKKKKSKGY